VDYAAVEANSRTDRASAIGYDSGRAGTGTLLEGARGGNQRVIQQIRLFRFMTGNWLLPKPAYSTRINVMVSKLGELQ
jgi:hypothetical protein